jgi:hypothetical protein
VSSNQKLPVPVLEEPHWRVRLRSEGYEKELIPSLKQCLEIIEQTKLSIRGWDYPHLSHRDSERELGNNWIASWSDFLGHNEYWRLYQSGQFLHLFSVQEAANPEWREQLRVTAKGHLNWGSEAQRDWSSIPGFISVLNFLFTVTEIFEFASRLCAKGIYRDQLRISVEVKQIKGFVLVHEWSRAWMHYYSATEDNLGNEWIVDPKDLLAQSKEYSLAATRWFFERFGWLNPTEQVLRSDQDNFLSRRF